MAVNSSISPISMKRWRAGALAGLIVFAALFAAIGVRGQDTQATPQNGSPLPPPTGFVNDYAGVIDAATKQQLEDKLKDLRDTTNPSVEIAVAVVKTTGERDIFDYSLAVARGWKIGSKADNNPSALLFVAIDDHKYFTQVSRDLEGDLPDGLVGSLQRQYLVPQFKQGNYSKGISDTIDAYIKVVRNGGNTAGLPTPPTTSGGTSDSGGGLVGIFCCGIVILVIVLIIFSRGHGGGGPNAADQKRWGGGGFGSAAATALPWVIGGLLGGSGGGSGGGDSGGSSGGFGGFGGGGDFGGGGAGGSW